MPGPELYSVHHMLHGEVTIFSQREGETFHCGLGPVAEAKLLYVDQLELDQRWSKTSASSPLVVWDVGFGAAANASAVLTSWASAPEAHLHLVSLDRTLGPIQCALEAHAKNRDHFRYLEGWDLAGLLATHSVKSDSPSKSLRWELKLCDFVESLADFASGAAHTTSNQVEWARPQAILYDCYSPARNWEMWQLGHWSNLRKYCGEENALGVSYSRATGARVTMLLAGFFVGRGCATGNKEETTLVATRLHSLRDPLDKRWLERVRRSHTAHPFIAEEYSTGPISSEWMSKLETHPQFLG